MDEVGEGFRLTLLFDDVWRFRLGMHCEGIGL